MYSPSLFSTLPAVDAVDFKNHPVLLRRYVSRQAYGKGRALLEALGLSTAKIKKYYGMYPLNEEESVQEGILAWIGEHLNSTWGDVLNAMKVAGIDIQQCKGLEEELCELLLSLACVYMCFHMTVCWHVDVQVFQWMYVGESLENILDLLVYNYIGSALKSYIHTHLCNDCYLHRNEM